MRAMAGEPDASDSLKLCEQLSAELLDDVRGVVHAMRDADGLDIATSLQALASPLPATRLELNIAPEVHITDPVLAETLLRVVQEALTNTARHGAASRLKVDVATQGDDLRLTIEDDGRPDRILPDARELPVPDLPDDCLVYLMGSRHCETDRLSQTAWDIFGTFAPGWGRVQAICDFVHNHIRFDYMQARSDGFRDVPRARRRLSRLCAYCH